MESDKPRILQQWYDGLSSGNFPLLHELLIDHRNLLKIGWGGDSSSKVKRLNELREEALTEWKGSTALIEAATFGCVTLVNQSLEIYSAPLISSTFPTIDEEGPSLHEREETNVELNQDESRAAYPSREDKVIEMPELKDGEHAEEPLKDASADAGLVTKFRKAVWSHSVARFERALTKKRTLVEDQPGHETDEAKGEGTSDELRKLLVQKSGWWDMDAISIAVVCGSDQVLGLLVHAMGKCKEPLPYGIKPHVMIQRRDLDDSIDRGRLRETTREVLVNLPATTRELCEGMYLRDPHFNSLPIEEYLFLFLCQRDDPVELKTVKWKLWKQIMLLKNLWRFALSLQDKQGRPPFHAALRSNKTDSFLSLLKDAPKEVIMTALTTSDRAGRSPVHVAAALDRKSVLQVLLDYALEYAEVSKTCTAKWQYEVPHPGDPIPIDINELSKSNDLGYHHGPYTAVHAALLHKNFDCAKLLIEHFPQNDWGTYMYTCAVMQDVIVEFDTMELACFMRADTSVIRLLKDAYLGKRVEFSVDDQARKPAKIFKHPWHAVHIVAASGNFENLKLFVNDSLCELSTLEDHEGNSALHHALGVREFGFQTHLVDHFTLTSVCEEIRSRTTDIGAQELLDVDQIEKRQGCIDLLLQVGCDVFAENKLKRVPYPGPALANNEKLTTWWSEKQANELEGNENDCVNAANAISVTAALVATTSYVGPLQPPLSYGENGIHENNAWVIIFMVCDTLSFYLAIAAITISLIPSLPAARQALNKRPYTPRDMVTLSVVILYPAIVFIFIAFACSSLAVASANVTSTVAGQLTMVTTVIGGVICLLAFILFTIRLLVFILPDNDTLISFNDLTKLTLTKAKSNSKFKSKFQ